MTIESASFVSALDATLPASNDKIFQGDDHLRLLKTVLKATLPSASFAFPAWADEVSIADSATPAIGGAASLRVTVAGTTTITGFDTVAAGVFRVVRWSTTRKVTYNGTSVILQDGVAHYVKSGDLSLFYSQGSGNWRELAFVPATRFMTGEVIKTGDYTVLTSDADSVLIANKATAITFTLPAIVSAGVRPYVVRNIGAGDLTVDANAAETIEGALTLVLPTGRAAILLPNGTLWRAQDISAPGLVTTAIAAAIGSFKGYLWGLTLSNNAGGTTAIDIAAGCAVDSTGAAFLTLASALTGKVLGTAWSVGNSGGLLDTGAVGDSIYYVYLIRRPDTGVVDAIASLSATAPTLPANYTQYRYIGPITRKSAAIVLFTQIGDWFWLKTGLLDVSVTNLGSSRTAYTVSVPPNKLGHFRMTNNNGNRTWVGPTDETDAAPSPSAVPLFTFKQQATGQDGWSTQSIRVDASGQIAARDNNTGVTLRVLTLGWFDTRGRDS